MRYPLNLIRFVAVFFVATSISACQNAGVGEPTTNIVSQAQPPLLPISFSDFTPVNCEVLNQEQAVASGSWKFRISEAQPCMLILQHDKLKTLPLSAWLSFDAHVDGLESPTANMMFWSSKNQQRMPDLTSASALFPGLKARMSFPLTVLAEGRGAPKTPGTLIQFAFGKGVELEDWSRYGLNFMKLAGGPAIVEIENFRFTTKQPSYPVPDTPIIDRLGQWIQKDWLNKVTNTDDMVADLKAAAKEDKKTRAAKFSQYGGIKSVRFDATGFFRTEHDGKRWWLVDPEGYGFYSIGIDIVNPGIAGNVDGAGSLHEWMPAKQGTFADAWETQEMFDILSPEGKQVELLNFHTANLIRAYGSDWHDQWTRMTRNRLVEWNVNTIGNWSDLSFAAKAKIPYVVPLQDFPVTKKRIFRDFPDVFSDEYKSGAQTFAKQLEVLRDDKYLIGYFMNNEPGWAYVPSLNLAEELLNKGDGFATKAVLIQYLEDQYGNDIAALNQAWGTELLSFSELNTPIKQAASLSKAAAKDLQSFSSVMLSEYVKVMVDACKAVDPHHLNMGMRWASGALKESWRFSGTEHLDVFSMNAYTDNPAPRLDIAAAMVDKPILIGEFHHGSMEAGHSAFGARWTKTEAERVIAYRHYAEQAANHPSSIGIHYFSYNDDPVIGRFDGQNFHQGMVSVTHEPYSDFVDGYKAVNDTLYDVVTGKRSPLESVPEGMIKSVPMSF